MCSSVILLDTEAMSLPVLGTALAIVGVLAVLIIVAVTITGIGGYCLWRTKRKKSCYNSSVTVSSFAILVFSSLRVASLSSSIACTKVCYITIIIIVSTLINRDSKEQLVHDDEPFKQEKVSMLVNSVSNISILLHSNHYHSWQLCHQGYQNIRHLLMHAKW